MIVLSPAAVSSDEVRGELRAALNLGKHVVPALYEPCDIPRLLQNVQYVDFSMAVDRTSRGDELAAALVSGAQTPRRREGHDGLAARTLRNRHDYLHDVKSEVAGRLEQSLQPRMLNVPKEKQPEQVTRSWDATVRVANHQRSALPLEAHAVEVFDDEMVSGRLLILGAPGGGKTTALLELCQELVARAEADVAEPLPVLCNLSSWRDNGQSIVEWLVDQLKLKYGVRKDNGHQWLADRDVVPLLDGLDEVTPEDQERCVQAINQFQDDCRPKSIVVCCRIAEYENYRVKLQLNGAIRLLPLADEQIREYLVNAGCADLWQSISADTESIELARSPLLLRIMTVVYAEMAPADWQRLASASERQARLFDIFISRLLSDDAAGRYTRARTIRWLAWLGSTMRDHGQAEFLLEQMQPQWLRSRARLWLYRAGVMVACAAILVSAIYLSQLLFSVVPDGRLSQDLAAAVNRAAEGWLWQHRDAVLITMFGVALGLVLASRETIQPIETLVWSRSRAWRGFTGESRRIGLSGLNRVAYVGVLIGLLIGTSSVRDSMAATAVSPELSGWSTAGFVMAIIAVLLLTVTAALTLKPRSWLSGEHGSRWPDGIVSAVVSGAIIGALGTLTAGPLLGASSGVALATVLVWPGAQLHCHRTGLPGRW